MVGSDVFCLCRHVRIGWRHWVCAWLKSNEIDLERTACSAHSSVAVLGQSDEIDSPGLAKLGTILQPPSAALCSKSTKGVQVYHCRVLVVAAQSSGYTCHLACKEKVVCRPCSLASSKSWINPILGLVAARYSCKMVAGVRLGACKEKVFCLLSHSFAVLAVPPQVDIAVLPL